MTLQRRDGQLRYPFDNRSSYKYSKRCRGLSGFSYCYCALAALSVFVAFLLLPGQAGFGQSSDADFTIIVLPDPQNETQYYPQVLNNQVQWIVSNQKALNIQFVLTEGDNINDGASTAQLQSFDAALRLLDGAAIPYLLAVGNHDYNGFNPKASRDLTGFNQWFGPARYAGKAYFAGSSPNGSNANSYGVLTINGRQYLFMTLEFRPTSASLDWAESILANNPDKEAIIVNHSFMFTNNKREDLCDDQDMPAGNATGQEVWMRLRKYKNIIMFLSGHFTGGSAARRADLGDAGNLVNQLFADYQDYPNGGNGWLRILTFHPASNSISVQTYSPFLNRYMGDATNQFTLTYHNPSPASGSGSISGKVRAVSGCAVIAGARVIAGSSSATTAADGTYRLDAPPGNYTVSASAGGWLTRSNSERVSDSLDTQLNFYMTASSACTATTTGVKVCAPVSGSTVDSPVRFVAAAKSALPITTIRIYIDNISVFDVKSSTLDVSLPVASGTHNVVIQAWDSSGAVFKTPISINVRAAPTPTPTPTPAPGTISGTITNASNATPVSGVTVSTTGQSTTSSSTGNYTLAALSPGTYNVTASKSGWLAQTKTASVTAGASVTLNFAIATAGKIAGTITSSTGAVVSGATVTFKGGVISNTTSVTSSSTGTYSSAWIPVGSYTVTVSMSGRTTQTKSATVTAGATTTVNFSGF